MDECHGKKVFFHESNSIPYVTFLTIWLVGCWLMLVKQCGNKDHQCHPDIRNATLVPMSYCGPGFAFYQHCACLLIDISHVKLRAHSVSHHEVTRWIGKAFVSKLCRKAWFCVQSEIVQIYLTYLQELVCISLSNTCAQHYSCMRFCMLFAGCW